MKKLISFVLFALVCVNFVSAQSPFGYEYPYPYVQVTPQVKGGGQISPILALDRLTEFEFEFVDIEKARIGTTADGKQYRIALFTIYYAGKMNLYLNVNTQIPAQSIYVCNAYNNNSNTSYRLPAYRINSPLAGTHYFPLTTVNQVREFCVEARYPIDAKGIVYATVSVAPL